MKNVLKKTFAAVLAAALCLSLAGCYSENNTWAAKKGDNVLPIGSYIYYLDNAYSEARSKVSSGEEVLKAKITDEDSGEETDSESWIKNRANTYLNAYYFICDKFDELGLELTEDELSNASSSTDSLWTYYRSTLEAMGIAKESFHTASSLYNAKYQKVMRAMYGKDGEMEISDDELKTYFTDNYYSYEYFSASLTKNDEDGNSVDMTDEEKADTKSKLEAYVKKINDGSLTVEDAATEYAEEVLGNAANSTYSAPSPTFTDSMSDALKDAIDGLQDNTAGLAETTTAYYVVLRLPVADKFQETAEDETQWFSLVSNMKGEDFRDYVMEQAAKGVEGVEINERALNIKKLSSLVNDNNKTGTSSASSETGSDETSSTSSETSSDGTSSESSEAGSEAE